MKLLTLIALQAACGSDAKSTGVGGSATLPASKPAVDPWAPGPVIPLPAGAPAWRLTLTSHYGGCDPSDKRPCHITWTATPDGAVEMVAHPNDDGPSTTTRSALTAAQRDRLAALIATKEFRDGMANGFPCEGPGPEHDASLRLTFDPAAGRATSQYVLRCTRAETPTVPGDIVDLLR